MFKKLKVDNFKSLVGFSIELMPMSVIIGNNATGKSSILQAIDFLCGSVREDFAIMLERRNWTADNIKSKLITSNKIKFESDILLPSDEGDLNYEWNMVVSIYSGKNEISLFSENLICNGKQLIAYQKGKDGLIKNEGEGISVLPQALTISSSVLRLLNRDEKIEHSIKIFIDFLLNSSSFEMLSPSEMRLSSRGIKESIGMSGKNLPSFIKQMSEDQKTSFMTKLKSLLGDRISDVAAETKGKPGWTQIVSKEKYKNKSIHISSKEMSDGMLRLLAFIAISEIRSSDATMLLDEIENGVNTSYAERLLDILKKMYTEKKHQLILTTHSTVFMDYIDTENIIFLYRDDNGCTKAVRLFEDDRMKEKLEYMYPGEILLNMSQKELLDCLLTNH